MQEKQLRTIQETDPKEAVFKLLEGLEKRSRDVIIRRFGLEGKPKETLEAIGQSYGITRERVRQIEADALASLEKPGKLQFIKPLEEVLVSTLESQGEIVEKNVLLSLVQDKFSNIYPNVLEFILELSPKFIKFNETKELKQAWATSTSSLIKAKKIIRSFIDYLKEKTKLLSTKAVINAIQENVESDLQENAILSYVNLSKSIRKNPFSEWGLISWGTILPQGVKDKAYLILTKKKKPLHFREITEAINQIDFDKRKATSRTVHNALIKDPRFVLVGRGTYGLTEAGYKPGTVADIVASVLGKEPLEKEEVVHEVLKQRLVRKNTILLALQDKSKFKKVGEKYYLIQK